MEVEDPEDLVFVNDSNPVNTESRPTQSVEDNLNLELTTLPAQSFGQCLIPNCTENCYFGFKDSEQPFLCSLHCYDNMVDFRAKGAYKLYSNCYACFSNEIVKVYCAIFVIVTNS
jgi:hypothetical protein